MTQQGVLRWKRDEYFSPQLNTKITSRALVYLDDSKLTPFCNNPLIVFRYKDNQLFNIHIGRSFLKADSKQLQRLFKELDLSLPEFILRTKDKRTSYFCEKILSLNFIVDSQTNTYKLYSYLYWPFYMLKRPRIAFPHVHLMPTRLFALFQDLQSKDSQFVLRLYSKALKTYESYKAEIIDTFSSLSNIKLYDYTTFCYDHFIPITYYYIDFLQVFDTLFYLHPSISEILLYYILSTWPLPNLSYKEPRPFLFDPGKVEIDDFITLHSLQFYSINLFQETYYHFQSLFDIRPWLVPRFMYLPS